MNAILPEPVAVTLLVIDLLEQLEIPYVIPGSLASLQLGMARSTFDSDIVVELKKSQVSLLISHLQDVFYADEEMALNAVGKKSGFNLIHLETMFKVDLLLHRIGPLTAHKSNAASRMLLMIEKSISYMLKTPFWPN